MTPEYQRVKPLHILCASLFDEGLGWQDVVVRCRKIGRPVTDEWIKKLWCEYHGMGGD